MSSRARMPSHADPALSAAARPLRLRMRADLRTQRQTYLGRNSWVVKDPLTLKYYRFEEEEFALLQMLDGHASLIELRQEFERRFAPQKIALRELHQLIGMLHRSALVVGDVEGQGARLLNRGRERSRRERWATLSNVLCIRFRGVDPDHWLHWLNRRVGWFFSLPCFAFCLLLVVSALLLVAVQFDVFQNKLPSFADFFASRNWIWLALTLGATKVLHEFGHGLSCKRFGGECHEMGFMLLVLTPCLYCNVSDSWMLPSKWKRAAIGAAGMYVEVVLAAICTFLWWFTHPGLLNYLCLNVMFVCSVNTLLFNANPLLRYDGYYILSDLLEIPNLRQKANLILQRKLAAWTLGLPEPPDPFLPRRRQLWFAAYTIASAVYRWIITAAILWFLYRVFEPYGLQIVGQLIAIAALCGLVLRPLWQLVKFFRVPGRIDRVSKPRMYASLAGVGVLLAGIIFIPLPHHVRCGFYLQPRGAAAVYVESAGTLRQIHVQPGAAVRRGQPIMTLENADLELAMERLAGERRRLEARLASLRQRAFEDEVAASEMAEVEQAVSAINQQVLRRDKDRQALQIVAPADGLVIPAPMAPKRSDDPSQLRGWYGSPLESKNVCAFMASGTPVCQVGDPRHIEAILAVDQAEIEFVRPGQSVVLLIEQRPGRVWRSELSQVSQLDMKSTPRSLSSKSGGEVLTTTDGSGVERPLTTTYQASAVIALEADELFLGGTGQAKIHAGYRTLAQRIWRYLCQTFNFEV